MNGVRQRFVAFMAFILLVAGCATMVTPESVKERIFVVTEQSVAIASTAERLYDNATIDGEEYSDVLDSLEEANTALSEARTLADAGEAIEAEDRVALANSLLVTIRNRLQEAQNE